MDFGPQQYQTVVEHISAAARDSGRDPADVSLLAVSKRQSLTQIRALAALGQRRFGENYLQEALAKMDALASAPLEWHFIGKIQSNKTRAIAERFDWVHSVERLKIAERLSEQRSDEQEPLNVCIEVNVDDERSKSGIPLAEAEAFAIAIGDLPRLKVRGLMALPAPRDDYQQQRRAFQTVSDAFAILKPHGFDTLSMGTSHDYRAAIAAGATMLRLGTILFGPRSP